MSMPQSYSPINDYPDASPRGGCSCFRSFCFGREEGGSHIYLLQERGGLHLQEEQPWLVIQLKKLKQFSEVVTGPKWKNLVRRIGKLCNPKRETAAQFQYSPESYALNFAGDQEDGNLLHSFSSRFAPHVLVNYQQMRDVL